MYLETSPHIFWDDVTRKKRVHDADESSVYPRLLLEHARRRRLPITRSVLTEHGARVKGSWAASAATAAGAPKRAEHGQR